MFGYVKEGPAPKHWKCGAEFSYTNAEGATECCLKCSLKPYSSNIKHAMEVDAEMLRQKYLHVIERFRDGRECVRYYKNAINDWPVGKATADTLEEAICLAALEAKK